MFTLPGPLPEAGVTVNQVDVRLAGETEAVHSGVPPAKLSCTGEDMLPAGIESETDGTPVDMVAGANEAPANEVASVLLTPVAKLEVPWICTVFTAGGVVPPKQTVPLSAP
jgi:hypothetical protein